MMIGTMIMIVVVMIIIIIIIDTTAAAAAATSSSLSLSGAAKACICRSLHSVFIGNIIRIIIIGGFVGSAIFWAFPVLALDFFPTDLAGVMIASLFSQLHFHYELWILSS